MARLTDNQREDIRNALILGESQYKVANDYEVSSATVNKIYKTISQDEFLVKEVKDEIAVKSKLYNKSERLSKAFDEKVNDELRRQNLIYNIQEKALNKANNMIDKIDTPFDLKTIVETVDKASITLGVNQRHANSQVNIQNTNAVQNNLSLNDFYEE